MALPGGRRRRGDAIATAPHARSRRRARARPTPWSPCRRRCARTSLGAGRHRARPDRRRAERGRRRPVRPRPARSPPSRRGSGSADEPVVGYISSFTGYEGIRYLIAAAAELRRRGRRVRCLLVGDGEDRSALEAAAVAAGVDDGTVIFTGRVPHDRILDYYRLIDVFVVPRTNDRVSQLVTPLKPYEAMAMERALVVSGVGALLEIVDRWRDGPVVPPGGPDRPGRRGRAPPRRSGRAGAPRTSGPRVGDRQPDLDPERAALPRPLRAARGGLTVDPRGPVLPYARS